MILYFTGTGNTRFIANNLAELLDDEIICMNNLIKNKEYPNFTSEKPFVFLAPIYAWRIPPVVDSFIRKCKYEGNNDCYFIVNYGGHDGNAYNYVKNTCDYIGLNLKGYSGIAMPSNTIMSSNAPGDEELNKKLSNAKNEVNDIAKMIKNYETFKKKSSNIIYDALTVVVNPLFPKLFNDKGFHVNNNCVSCAGCVNICTLNNINLSEGKPEWNNNCTFCLACLNACPQSAIEYKNQTVGKKRYFLHDNY